MLPSNYKQTKEYMSASTAQKRAMTKIFNKQPKDYKQGSLFKEGGIIKHRIGGPFGLSIFDETPP